MKLAVILVHYHTPELLSSAWEALAHDAETAGIELEPLLVDNGSRPEDGARLKSLPVRLLVPGRNLGYAGGANLGIEASCAELVLIMNPDVVVLPGCLPALIKALEAGATAAGPRFYWDHGKQFLLPPTEAVSRRAELLRVLARCGGLPARWGRGAWRRHARRHWLAREPFRSFDLSGALLAIRRSAWQRAGPFDPRYPLYFEETDWLQRLRRTGLEARFVPAAEAVHLYAQSTLKESRAETWFLESGRRFRRRAFGAGFTRLLELLSRRLPPLTQDGSRWPQSLMLEPGSAAWVEVSQTPVGYPAAGHPLTARGESQIVARARDFSSDQGAKPQAYWSISRIWQGRTGGKDSLSARSDFHHGLLSPEAGSTFALPAEIRRRLAPGTYFLRAVDAGGHDLAVARLEQLKPPPP